MATSPSAPSPDAPVIAETTAPGVGPWTRLQPGVQLALWLLVTLRIGYELVLLLSLHTQPITVVGGDWLNLWMHGGPWTQLLSVWQRWDALWYQHIAQAGYHANDYSTHFQPLYPLIIRLVSLPLLGQTVLASLVVSSVAFALAMWLLYRLALLDVGPEAARLAVLLTALFPFGFFLLAPYTESLFLLLTVASFWFARNDRPWIAGIFGFAAALTRHLGIFLILPLAFIYLQRRNREGKRPGIDLASAILPPLGLILFTLYKSVVVGDHQGLVQQSTHFGVSFLLPWQTLSNSWAYIRGTGDPIETFNFACLIGFTLLSFYMLRRLPVSYALYVWPYLALLYAYDNSVITPLAGVARYTLVLFPCFIFAGDRLVRHRWLAGSILLIGAFLQVYLLQYWTHFGFVA